MSSSIITFVNSSVSTRVSPSPELSEMPWHTSTNVSSTSSEMSPRFMPV